MRLLLALAAILLGTGCASQAQVPAPGGVPKRRATLLFTGDLWGQLEPCGCSADMRGGVDRLASFVRETRAAGPTLLVDAGDALHDELEVPPEVKVQADRRAAAMVRALVAMGIDAKVAFERDAGGAFPPGVLVTGPAVREVGGVRVGLAPFDALPPGTEAEALRQRVEATRALGADVVVALVHGVRDRVVALAPHSGADLLVGSHVRDIPEGDRARAALGKVPVFFTQARGQSVLRIDLVLRGDGPLQILQGEQERDAEIESIGERIRSYEQRASRLSSDAEREPFRRKVEELRARRRALSRGAAPAPAEGSYLAHRFVPVTRDLPSDGAVKEILTAYDREIASANLAFAKAQNKVCEKPSAGEAGYVGEAACATCHQAAHDFWAQTRHAEAYATLERANKQYDLACVSCHVTGWEKPGGACRVDEVDHRKDVGCESCHGPGSLHAANPVAAKLERRTAEATCRGCHTADHSTEFDYAAYLSRILGPGHGAPVAAETARP
ncbi:MAG TPA: multiheme c-type cytochrome [Vulgatibacter sp.]|nr:multiheme c-type cytochrome [Vulgatibacter sp.]